eukprot:c9373_g1_i2.p1 GENE.c9373_g1_i2~~c9373_g1_i2.p1  ORF type:complete len:391 (+),score=49.61 c9373_g1_i2:204-1376(+)
MHYGSNATEISLSFGQLMIHARSQATLELLLAYGADATSPITIPNVPQREAEQILFYFKKQRPALASTLAKFLNADSQALALASLFSTRRLNPLRTSFHAGRNAFDSVLAVDPPLPASAERAADMMLDPADAVLPCGRHATALHLRAAYGSLDSLVEALRDHAANIFVLNSSGELAVDLASTSRRDSNVKTIFLLDRMRQQLESGAAPPPVAGAIASPGEALLSCIRIRRFGMHFLRAVIAAGCDLNVRVPSGPTFLHAAVRLGDTTVVEALLGMGADPRALGEDDMPLHSTDPGMNELLLGLRPLAPQFAALRGVVAAGFEAVPQAAAVSDATVKRLAHLLESQNSRQEAEQKRQEATVAALLAVIQEQQGLLREQQAQIGARLSQLES